MTRALLFVIVSFGLLLTTPVSRAVDTPLAAALANDIIRVDVDYTGARVTLFAVSSRADDPKVAYAVALVGPHRPYVVTRKTDDGKERFEFISAPAVLAVAAEADLAKLASPDAMIRAGIHARYAAKPATDQMDNPDLGMWRHAFADLKTEAGLFRADLEGVERLEGGLIRADIDLPAAAPPGDYDVRIFMFEDGVLTAEAEAPLSLKRHGTENALFNLSRNLPWLYGLIAVFLGAAVGSIGVLLERN